ncbi:TIGR04438 family Trp-rich protein [Ideonella sp.]|uniref:TIGR04438 family Trp-rich protein n=1 Tax=Ideonella sp. TaxID=1929293 RepID=UPI0035B19F78
MIFIIIGVALIALKLLGVNPMAEWNYELTGDLWKMVWPFVAALIWWAWSDASGWTRRREMERDDQRKAERRARNIANMGLGPKDGKGGQGRRR